MGTKGIVVSGLSGGAGKSVAAVGLAAALLRRGEKVVPFKKGPDYIDAGWLQQACGTNCYNLDPFLMTREAILSSFHRRLGDADMVIVEGNRGLYDGVDAAGGYSTAELALTLDLPVVLVVNCTKTTRTVAAMVLGCRMLDKRLKLAGVILNHIATERQKLVISEAVERYAGVKVLGALPRLKREIFPMRHLGMVPHQEYDDAGRAVATLADLVETNVDIDALIGTMATVAVRQPAAAEPAVIEEETVRIGVLQDTAFQFYYAENLEALRNRGAELVFLNAVVDTGLPPLDGLYIGGGFPETSAAALAGNSGFLAAVRDAAERGLPVYAECGGLIYLGRSIRLADKRYPLVGLFAVDFTMAESPQAHGYTILRVDRENGFYPVGERICGHEFRYSQVAHWQGDPGDLVFRMERGKGFVSGRDGLRKHNALALYTHVHAEGTPLWAKGFVDRCRRVKTGLSG